MASIVILILACAMATIHGLTPTSNANDDRARWQLPFTLPPLPNIPAVFNSFWEKMKAQAEELRKTAPETFKNWISQANPEVQQIVEVFEDIAVMILNGKSKEDIIKMLFVEHPVVVRKANTIGFVCSRPQIQTVPYLNEGCDFYNINVDAAIKFLNDRPELRDASIDTIMFALKAAGFFAKFGG